jgi:hypothetical protein
MPSLNRKVKMRQIMMLMAIPMSVCFVGYVVTGVTRYSQKKRTERIKLGMSEEEMLSIMGKGFSKCSYADGTVVYEYLFSNATSRRSGSFRIFYSARRTLIFCYDGKVEAVKTNL